MYTTLIDARRLMDHLGAEHSPASWVVIDCRFSLADPALGLSRYLEAHIPGARYAHLDDDLSGTIVPGVTGRHPLPERSDLVARFRYFGIRPSSQLICYDDSNGAIAGRLWWLSRWLGHAACAVLDGGMPAWQRTGGPLTSGMDLSPDTDRLIDERGAPGGGEVFDAGRPLVKTVDIDTVASGAVLPVDAREHARYAGRTEPIDPIAGHIPGAVNMPFADNLDDRGEFLPADTLRARFQPLLDKAGQRPLVHYCGSGVTAAHNLLAMAHAGLDVPALYPGSWSEWVSRDDGRYPVATLDD